MADILVVDDEPGFRQILSIILKRAGHTPRLANNTAEARAQIAQAMPDLIILDDDMPGEKGSDYCRILKANPTTSHIPVVLYSAGAHARDSAFIASIGADDAVKKPSMPKDVTDAVERCLAAGAGV
ncbi:MAG: response regulator [Chloroflexota bacterium]